MFDIVENKYLASGLVKYENENGDKLMIIAEKDGGSFKAKIRPASGIDVDVVKLKFPYVEQGVNFHCVISSGKDIELDRRMLSEAVEKIQNWTEIMRNMRTLLFCDLDFIAVKAGDGSVVPYCNSLLSELNSFEEMHPFVTFFCKVANSSNIVEAAKTIKKEG